MGLLPDISSNADLYSWIGPSGGQWTAPGNWRNLTSGTNPAVFIPGTLTPVTIAGPGGTAIMIIAGGGASASLGMTGNVLLADATSTGSLTVGVRNIVGAGSSSVSYVYAAGALTIVSTLSAGTINIASGSLALSGAGTALTATGTITLGAQSVIGNSTPSSYDPGTTVSLSAAAGTSLTSSDALLVRQGTVSVNGVGAVISITGAVTLGVAGAPFAARATYSLDAPGLVTVANGGLFAAGSLTGTVGSLLIDGPGSRLTVQTILTLGLAANGIPSLNVTRGGLVQAGSMVLAVPVTGNAGPSATAPPSLFVDPLGAIKIGTGTAAAGTLTIDAGRSVTATTTAAITATILNNGVLSATGGILTLTGSLSGAGTLQIGRYGTVSLNGSVAAGGGIVFTDPTATLNIGTDGATAKPYAIGAEISGLQLGNTILFSVIATSIAYSATGSTTGTLTLSNGGIIVSTLVLAGNYTPRSFLLSPGGNSSQIGLQTVPLTLPPADFDGDGYSDLIWQQETGLAAIWRMHGTISVGSAVLGNPGAGWRIKATGDFNGDGKADILWQNDNGTPAIWTMNGLNYIAGASLNNPGAGWRIKASGDFNGDGKADILWQNDNGTPAIWTMNGLNYVAGATLNNMGTHWHVMAAGDFDGDGKSDILWQNDDGSVAIWKMNGLTYVTGATIGNPGTKWHIKGTGDFNGDGKSDILWQNDDGPVAIWLMNGLNYLAGASLGNSDPSWHVKSSLDINGDGKSDILWQRDDGSVAVWLMNGLNYIGGAVLGNSGTSWHAIGSDGMRFISGADGNGTLAATSEIDQFNFTTYTPGAHAISGFNPAQDLVAFALASFSGFAAVQAHSTASGGGTLIALDGSASLLIQGIAPSALAAANFKFV